MLINIKLCVDMFQNLFLKREDLISVAGGHFQHLDEKSCRFI